MEDGTPAQVCVVPGCETAKVIARGYCRKHYSRWQRTKTVGDDSDRACLGCGTLFPPRRSDQKFCTVACTRRTMTRRAHGLSPLVPRKRVCRWCETEFEHDDGRRAFCSPPCEAMTKRLQSVRNIFGLTTAEYRALWLKHDGQCAVCGGAQVGPKGFLCIDHDHETGRVRGLLCDPCNRGIGLLKDSRDILLKAAAYLE